MLLPYPSSPVSPMADVGASRSNVVHGLHVYVGLREGWPGGFVAGANDFEWGRSFLGAICLSNTQFVADCRVPCIAIASCEDYNSSISGDKRWGGPGKMSVLTRTSCQYLNAAKTSDNSYPTWRSLSGLKSGRSPTTSPYAPCSDTIPFRYWSV